MGWTMPVSSRQKLGGMSYDLGIFIYILPIFRPTAFPVKNPEKKALTKGKNPHKDSHPSRN
jgi:hypothetical protein